MSISVFQTSFPPSNTPVSNDNGDLNQTWMAFFRSLFLRTGEGTGLPNQVNDNVTDLDLMADWNFIPIGGAANVNLPALTGGQMIMVQNNSLLAVTVNPPTGATLDGLVGPYSLPATKMQIFWFLSPTQVISTQLG